MAETYAEYYLRVLLDCGLRLLEKPLATAEELAKFRLTSWGSIEFNIGGDMFRPLDNEPETDKLDAADAVKANANRNGPFWDKHQDAPLGFSTLPALIDHTENQTRIKDQGSGRNTCVAFASLAAIEALIKSQQGVEVDLSEQFANWMFMKSFQRDPCNKGGLVATIAARFLKDIGVCEEGDFHYEEGCASQPSKTAKANARFGIGDVTIIGPGSLVANINNGANINNTDYLESILSGGGDPSLARDIVFATHVAWGDPDGNGIRDVTTSGLATPLDPKGGHTMLMVGYDRTEGHKPFFRMKNSWGTTANGHPVGENGYYLLSYDYVRHYGKYGFVVMSAKTDLPIKLH